MNRDSDDKVPTQDSSDDAYIHDVVGKKSDTIAGTSLVSLSKQILVAVGGEANQLRVIPSDSSGVEEDGLLNFSVSLMDIDSGSVASDDIDISAISAVLYKSTGGVAFSAAGITQPTFLKAAGNVYCDYQFLAAEWEIGDMYKLVVSGIIVTIGVDTAYVPSVTWSNLVVEELNVEAKIDAIQTVTDGIVAAHALLATAANLATTDGKVDAIQTVTDGIVAAHALLATAAQLEPTISSSSYTYIDAGGVQDIVEVVNTKKILVRGIFVDCNTLTQDGTLSFWTKIDGTNYRRVADVSFTQASDDSVMLSINIETDKDFKFTWEEGVDEAADRALPYKLSYETKN